MFLSTLVSRVSYRPVIGLMGRAVAPATATGGAASWRNIATTPSGTSEAPPRANEGSAARPPHDRSLLTGSPERQALVDRMLRVDHAGEYVAVQIYRGQLDVLGRNDKRTADTIQHMMEQEEVHLAKMEQLIPVYRARPTSLLPLCHIAGYALGAGTALLGKEAAMACTVAVETVIGEHYNSQLRELRDMNMEDELELRSTFRTFRDEEMEHHDTALEHGAEQAPGYEALSAAVRTGCRAAIFLAERF